MTCCIDTRANLSGRKAIVVGGADGIGRAITMALAEARVEVAFCDNELAEIPKTVSAVKAMGGNVLGIAADVMQQDQLTRFYEEAAEFFGATIDIVVNVAGGAQLLPFMERSRQDDANDIRRNFGYVIDSVRAAVPLLRGSGRGGSIINFTTIEAHRAAGGVAVYSGAKAATSNFSKALAWELGPDKIRVNVIVPDSTPSKGNMKAVSANAALLEMNRDVPAEYWGEAHKMVIPLGEPTTEDDLSNAVLYLASDLARHVTGIDLHVDAGTHAAGGMLRWPYDGGGTLPVPMGNTLRKLFG